MLSTDSPVTLNTQRKENWYGIIDEKGAGCHPAQHPGDTARSDPHPRRGADPAEVQEKVIIERADMNPKS